jgi:hypothetical protein
MATTKEDILKALAKLDHTDDNQWTDDGGPRMGKLQEFTNDKTLTRAQVNAAAPQFSRATAQATSEDLLGPATAPVVASDDFDDMMEPEIDGPGEQLTEDQVRAILARRVRTADENLIAARAATSLARQEEINAERRATRALLEFQRRFPPIHASEAIHAHLAAQQQRLLEQVTGNGQYGRSQIDQGMERRNSRGWSRPSRPVNTISRAG